MPGTLYFVDQFGDVDALLANPDKEIKRRLANGHHIKLGWTDKPKISGRAGLKDHGYKAFCFLRTTETIERNMQTRLTEAGYALAFEGTREFRVTHPDFYRWAISLLDMTDVATSNHESVPGLPEWPFHVWWIKNVLCGSELADAGREKDIFGRYRKVGLTDKSPGVNDSWMSTKTIIVATTIALGGSIYTDPCSSEEANKYVRAKRFFSHRDNGKGALNPDLVWGDNVYMYPPYGSGENGGKAFADRLVVEFGKKTKQAITLWTTRKQSNNWFSGFMYNFNAFFVVSGRPPLVPPRDLKPGNKNQPPDGPIFLYRGSKPERFLRTFAHFFPGYAGYIDDPITGCLDPEGQEWMRKFYTSYPDPNR